MRVGVLALQGDFSEHQRRINELGARAILVKRSEELQAVSALVIPGGESSTVLKLLDERFRSDLVQVIREGLPVLATCAGVILLAKGVSNPDQSSLDCIDIDVKRNAYGRQLDSFIDPALSWTAEGKGAVQNLEWGREIAERPLEGVFIRAPKITRVGEKVSVLIRHNDDPVLVKQGNVFGATFHPELSDDALAVHQLLLKQV